MYLHLLHLYLPAPTLTRSPGPPHLRVRAQFVSIDLAFPSPTNGYKDQQQQPGMPASGSTQALAPPTAHRGGGWELPEHPHCLNLLERMAPLRLAPAADRRLTRLLVNVTVDRSLWPVHLVLGADATVADLVRAAVAAYAREGRRPPLQPGGAAGGDPADAFELHFSKYSLESECANSSLISHMIFFP